MPKKFGASLTEAQYQLARAFERAGLTTISQAVKAFQRRDNAQIALWKQQLQDKREQAQEEQQRRTPIEQKPMGNQDPIILKSKHKIYPWDVVDAEKVAYAWTIWLRDTHVPLVITRAGDRSAYDQIEQVLGYHEETKEEE